MKMKNTQTANFTDYDKKTIRQAVMQYGVVLKKADAIFGGITLGDFAKAIKSRFGSKSQTVQEVYVVLRN
jgi:hypothetical protein